MKLVNYSDQGSTKVGIVYGDLIFDLRKEGASLGLVRSDFKDIDQILAEGALDAVLRAQGTVGSMSGGIPLAEAKVLPPLLRPEKILCVALNYVSHLKEGNVGPPPEPYFFAKFRNAIIGPGDDIVIPKISEKVDWEAELAVVIGRSGKYIPKEDAMDYVAGFTVANDISFRDLQFPPGWPEKTNPLGQNWIKGKSLDTAFPLGPWLVTKDDVPDPNNLRISLSVNGKVMQDSTTAEMVSKVDRLVASASEGITLKPGDIISTGTPLGVAAFSGQPFLKAGDVVEATVGGVGTLRNQVRSE